MDSNIQGSSGINTDLLQSAIDQVNNTTEDGYQVIQGNGKRPKKGSGRAEAGASGVTKRSVKTGAAKTGSLFAGPEKFHVQLTNVSPQITDERIRTYVTEKSDDIEIIEIKDTTTDGWETKRFLITFNMSDFKAVMDDAFWPEGIYYKQWFVRNVQKKQPGVL